MAATATPTCTARSRAVDSGRADSNALIGARGELSRFQKEALIPTKNGIATAKPTHASAIAPSDRLPTIKIMGIASADTAPIASTGNPRAVASIQSSAASGD